MKKNKTIGSILVLILIFISHVQCTSEPTEASIQTLTTDSIVFISSTTVVVGGLLPKSYRSVFERGVYYGTSPNPAKTGFKRVINSSNQAFSDTLTGLQPNAKYYVQAYAINSAGIGYGVQVEFITRDAIVSFSFDDGDMEQTDILDSMGVRGTIGFVTTWKLNLVKMHLIENEGWEIASHSVNHLKAPETEYKDSRDYLVAQGFKVDGFIYPGGGSNDQQFNWASKYYSWARDVVTYNPGYDNYRNLYNLPPFNRYKLRGAQTYTHSLDEFKKIVDSVDKDKGWLIWMIHFNQITNADLVSLIRYINSKNIGIMPIRDALKVYDAK